MQRITLATPKTRMISLMGIYVRLNKHLICYPPGIGSSIQQQLLSY